MSNVKTAAESEAAFQAATVDLGVSFAADVQGNYTDSRTACLWRVWCAALDFARPLAPGLPNVNPETGRERA